LTLDRTPLSLSTRVRPRRRALAQLQPNAWAAPLASVAVATIAVFANTNFHEKILPGGDQSNAQQYVVLAAWALVIFASYFRRPALRVDLAAPGVAAALIFYAFAMISVVWSRDAMSGAPKAAALALTSFGAWRLAQSAPLDEIVDAAVAGMFLLCVASIVLALFAPSIGLATEYLHAGQWNGVFASKQSLGVTAGVALYCACYRLMEGERRIYYAIAAMAALVCLIGSGSRGGAGLALVAVLFLFFSARRPSVAKVLAFAPFVMTLLGVGLICYLARTGYDKIYVFGQELDFTERTFIWQHALSYYPQAPWLGFGLNGFWTLKEVKDVFVERHTWFLDNFHDGYIAIVVETGAVGLALFAATYLLYGLRIRRDVRLFGALASQETFALVYSAMVFFIDFTETLFLRSTNMVASLLLVSFLAAFAARPLAQSHGARRACARYS